MTQIRVKTGVHFTTARVSVKSATTCGVVSRERGPEWLIPVMPFLSS